METSDLIFLIKQNVCLQNSAIQGANSIPSFRSTEWNQLWQPNKGIHYMISYVKSALTFQVDSRS